MHCTTNAQDNRMVAILFLLYISQRSAAAQQCNAGASSMTSYRFFGSPVVPDRETADLKACFDICRTIPRCQSINYNLNVGMCELNSKNHLTHPDNLEKKDGYVYLPVLDIVNEQPIAKSCAKIKETKPYSPSGVYELKVKGEYKSVYCDMDNYGGGWSLVVSINGSNGEHVTPTKNNCFNSSLCVPLEKSPLAARKLLDSDIRALAFHEGTFRVDVIDFKTSSISFSVFFRLPQGAQLFDSGCWGSRCPRMITSHVYPYQWESNCKGTEKGYAMEDNTCHRVFDSLDDQECGGVLWQSSQFKTKRILYCHCSGTQGIYVGQQGHLYVR